MRDERGFSVSVIARWLLGTAVMEDVPRENRNAQNQQVLLTLMVLVVILMVTWVLKLFRKPEC